MQEVRELRMLDEEELEAKLRELKETLFNLRFQHATGQLDNPMRIGETRKDIARVCTVMTERKYSIHPEAFEEAMYAPRREELEEPEEMVEEELPEELAEETMELEEPVVPESEQQLEEEVEEELKDL
jgi:large subunit ribosomal protein L29